MALGIKGLAGRFGFNGNGIESEVRQTDAGSLAIALMEPPYKEVARAGRKFICFPSSVTTLTGMGPVAAVPSTTCQFFLFNGDTTLSYVIDYLDVVVMAGTSAQGASLIGIMSKPTATAPTAGAYHSIVPANPGSARGSRSIIAEAYVIPTVDTTGKNSWPAWTFLMSGQLLAATVGGADASDSYKDGRLIIPPGWGLGLSTFSGAGTTPKFGLHAEWTELQLDLE